jgi:hypothetical protein
MELHWVPTILPKEKTSGETDPQPLSLGRNGKSRHTGKIKGDNTHRRKREVGRIYVEKKRERNK